MRNATPEEIVRFQSWYVTVTFTNPNQPQKKPQKRLGPFFGTKDAVEAEAVRQAQERWKDAENHRVLEAEDCGVIDNPNIFFWDWKEAKAVGDNSFFKRLDEMLAPMGAEVVHIPFDGDAYPWFVAPKNP